MSNIEVFDQKINEIKLSLDELKKETSVEQKNKKTEEAKEKITKTREEINKKLNELKAVWDATSLQDAKKLEENLLVLDSVSSDISTLENDIKTPDNKKEKWWFRRQREGVTSKEEWKENTWTNVWRVTMWIWAVSLAVWWIRKLFGRWKNRNTTNTTTNNEVPNTVPSEPQKTSRWKKALLRWAWIGWWVLLVSNRRNIKDWIGGLFGKEKNKVTIEEALTLVEWELWNISEDEKINAQRWKLEYDATNQEIKSYWLWTKINKADLRIDWFDLKFSDYKQLVHVANILNYMKFRYKWKWASANPFTSNWRTWDIKIKTKNWPDTTTDEVISWWLFSTLASLAPDVDWSMWQKALTFVWIKDGTSKDKFVAHINSIKWSDGGSLREQKDAATQPNPDKDPVIDEAGKLQTEIEKTLRLEWYIWWAARGTLEAKKIEWTNKYSINTWQKSTEIEIKSPSSIYVSGLELEFKDLKEAIRTANLINKLKGEYGEKCGNDISPFDYERERWGWKWLYIETNDWRWFKWYHVRILTDDTVKEKLPTVHDGDNNKKLTSYLNALTKEDWTSFWTKK